MEYETPFLISGLPFMGIATPVARGAADPRLLDVDGCPTGNLASLGRDHIDGLACWPDFHAADGCLSPAIVSNLGLFRYGLSRGLFIRARPMVVENSSGPFLPTVCDVAGTELWLLVRFRTAIETGTTRRSPFCRTRRFFLRD